MAKPRKRSSNQPVDLGELQQQVEAATENWREAREAKQAADQAFETAIEERETAITYLNQGIEAVKASCGIGDEDE